MKVFYFTFNSNLFLKSFWYNLNLLCGRMDENCIHILQMNGFNTWNAFKPYFTDGLSIETLVTELEDSIRQMERNDEDLKYIKMKNNNHKEFKFLIGQRNTIFGLFRSILDYFNQGYDMEQTLNGEKLMFIQNETAVNQQNLLQNDEIEQNIHLESQNSPIVLQVESFDDIDKTDSNTLQQMTSNNKENIQNNSKILNNSLTQVKMEYKKPFSQQFLYHSEDSHSSSHSSSHSNTSSLSHTSNSHYLQRTSSNNMNKIDFHPSNLQTTITNILRKKTKNSSEDFKIIRSITNNFPYKIIVKCFLCQEKELKFQITEDFKGGKLYYNARVYNYLKHLKVCKNQKENDTEETQSDIAMDDTEEN